MMKLDENQRILPEAAKAASRELRRVFVTGGSGFIGRRLIAFLRERSIAVVALARSEQSARKVDLPGVEVCKSDLHDIDAMARGMRGCDAIIHAGAYLPDWDMKAAMRENVHGSVNVATAARRAGVNRIVYVSGIGVTIGDGPVVLADERRPRGRPVGVLCGSRVHSEAAMLKENGRGLEVVVVRFPYVWGLGETLTRGMGDRIRKGGFRWIAGARHPITIVHVDSAAEGLILAAQRGRGGQIYWITDGQHVQLRGFIEAHLRRAGVTSPKEEVSFRRAKFFADTMAFLWGMAGSRKPPPITPTIVRFLGQEITVVDDKARLELGWVPRKRWPDESLEPHLSPS